MCDNGFTFSSCPVQELDLGDGQGQRRPNTPQNREWIVVRFRFVPYFAVNVPWRVVYSDTAEDPNEDVSVSDLKRRGRVKEHERSG